MFIVYELLGPGAIMMMEIWPFDLWVLDDRIGNWYCVWHQDDVQYVYGYEEGTDLSDPKNCDHYGDLSVYISAKMAIIMYYICIHSYNVLTCEWNILWNLYGKHSYDMVGSKVNDPNYPSIDLSWTKVFKYLQSIKTWM